MLLVLLMGCAAYNTLFGLLEEPAEPPCKQRVAWWPDADGDGAGSPAEVWVSCDQPDGWVAAAGDCDDADPTVTTGCADTADTGPSDTGPSDTGPSDTGPADTGDTSTPSAM